MKRVEELLEAATSRFRYDDGLRQEIARELRAHLEDTIAAARADGMDEAQAEEVAVRAFGDPEEIGERLWQANRRRLRRRAVVMAAVGMVLMPAGLLAAAWFIPWLFTEDVGPLRTSISFLAAAIAIIYFLSRWFLPRTAVFGLRFLRWLPAAFGKSLGIAFRTAWIWVPALAVFAIHVSTQFVMTWRNWKTFPFSQASVERSASNLWHSIQNHMWEVAPKSLGHWGWLLVYMGFLLTTVWMGRRLLTTSGLNSRQARRWHVALIVSASVLTIYYMFGMLFTWGVVGHTPFNYLNNTVLAYSIFIGFLFASIPCQALIWALFLTIVLRRLRGQILTLSSVLNSAFTVIWPMMWLFLIAVIGDLLTSLPLFVARSLNLPFEMWITDILRQTNHFLLMATAFLPVIIVSEHCGLRRACMRFGDFVCRHLWRYMAFVFLSAMLLGLPEWASGAALRATAGNWSVYVGLTLARDAIQIALQLGLAVMCFEFYLTRAGTIEPGTEDAAPQFPSEESSRKAGVLRISLYVALALAAAALWWVAFFRQPPAVEFTYRVNYRVNFGDAAQFDKGEILAKTIQRVQKRLRWHAAVEPRGEDGFVVMLPPPVTDAQRLDRLVTTIGALRFSLVDENRLDVQAAKRGENVKGCTPFLPVRDAGTGKILRDNAGRIRRWRKATYEDMKELPAEISDSDWYLVENKAEVTGEYLGEANAVTGPQDGMPMIAFSLRGKGRQDFEGLTEQYQRTDQHRGRLLAIVLDENLCSALEIHSRTAGSGIIRGSFTKQEVDDLVTILRAGPLPAHVERAPNNEPAR